tara:strand:+ start:183 stop:419 length:237 start_codon:yes stop_codon:yes gene_type:complete
VVEASPVVVVSPVVVSLVAVSLVAVSPVVADIPVVVLVVAKWVAPEWGGLECLAPVRSSVFPIATPVDSAVAIGHSAI